MQTQRFLKHDHKWCLKNTHEYKNFQSKLLRQKKCSQHLSILVKIFCLEAELAADMCALQELRPGHPECQRQRSSTAQKPPYYLDLADHRGMVKCGPVLMEAATDCLSRYAWGSQDGGTHEAADKAPAVHSGADRSPTHSGKVSPLPRRSPGRRRGLSIDRLPHKDTRDIVLAEGVEEPSLKANHGGY